MEVWNDDFLEVEIGSSVESFQRFLASQKELLHNQIDQFQEIVVTQCNLTGVNPLSQEMAAGALSIKIGKRPRDLLNPKAVNYMQSVFSIKDAISKKESREISALFGVTVTQVYITPLPVRDFFTSQRSRVRRLVQLSRERALRSNSCEEPHDGQINSDPVRPLNPAPLNSVGPTNAEEASCSTQEAALSDLDDLDKQFVDNIFSLMQKEETFSGQEKLMEWILTINNFSVLLWFLTRGGAMTLATWLSKAAIEEQTSVLLLILKVLCHLPLHKALPIHISAILQSVNRLRFYRTSDISNRARVLLSKWSKLLARNQAIKKLNGVKPSSDGQKEIMLSQSIGQIIGSESWHSNIDVPEDILALSNECSDNFRKLESPQAVKLLLPSSDDSNKKPTLGVSSTQSRERRKVQLVEQPGQKSVSRNPQVTRAGPVSQGRPMSADDIQKAKMRALFMQSKYGKTGATKERKEAKINGLNKPQTNHGSIAACSSKVPVPPKIEDDKKTPLLPSKTTNRPEASCSKMKMDLKEPLWEKCKRVQIPWKTPAEVKLKDTWRVGAGENSKEVDVQINRNRRDKETIYQTVQEMPSNPKEPWDIEMDYDDTLTLEIPIEQLPDVDGAEIAVSPNQVASHAVQGVATTSSTDNAATAEPDLELLAVLLKNPELVFALTSGQAGSIPTEETVKLLDMIKRGGVNLGLSENKNGNYGMSAKVPEKMEISLPSPTPSSDPRTSGWSTEVSKNPFSRRRLESDRIMQSSTTVVTTNLLSQAPATGSAVMQQPTVVLQSSKQHTSTTVSQYSRPQATNIVPERQPPHALSSMHVQTPSLDIGLTMKNIITANASSVNLPGARSPLAMRADGTSNFKPVPNLSVQEGLPNAFPQSFMLSSPTPSFSATQQQRHHPHLPQQAHFTEPSYRNTVHSYPPQVEKSGPVSDVWRIRQDMSSRYHTQRNHNNYNTMVGGSMQSGSSDRNNNGREEFESWSPENSPTRNPRYVPGRNYPESRMNNVRNHRPEWSRQRGSSGHGDPGRQGNKRWHDQRR
ncbi:homeobox protein LUMINIDEPENDENS [Gastrolobium bilobum]|uniref:homeobox protein LUMINIDEPENDENS n=1 Tax=Gastrolobium bilobum TaxID=150636 RepID=UPI002AB18E2F|nr:homeobox protein LUMINIDEPENDENS [Gastrolobium bilobum]